MKPVAKSTRATPADAARQLTAFIGKFEPTHQALIRGARKALRRRLPAAYELAYDNYNFFVIGYSPTERPSDAIISLTAAANGVGLCFLHGAKLPDPHNVLLGSGKQTRSVHLDSVGDLARPEIGALIDAAIARATVPFPQGRRGQLIIRSVSAKQRPRRRPAVQ